MYKTKVAVNFFDTDPAGIIFFANIFRYAHQAYEAFLKSLSTSRNYFFDDDYLLPIISANSDYIKPIKAGDELEVNVSVSNLKKNSFELSYSFLNEQMNEVAKVKTVHVCVSKSDFTKTKLPEELQIKLREHVNL